MGKYRKFYKSLLSTHGKKKRKWMETIGRLGKVTGVTLSAVYNSSSSTYLHAMSGAKAIFMARTE